MSTAARPSWTRSLELVAADAEVGGPERNVVVDRRHEQLVVGVLEDDADAAADLGEVGLRHGQVADDDLALVSAGGCR